MNSSDPFTRASHVWIRASRLGYREGAAFQVFKGRPSAGWLLLAPVVIIVVREGVKRLFGI